MAVDGPGDNEGDDQAGAGNPGGNDAPPPPAAPPADNLTVVVLMRLAAVEMTPMRMGKEMMTTRMKTLMTQARTPMSLTLNRRTRECGDWQILQGADPKWESHGQDVQEVLQPHGP